MYFCIDTCNKVGKGTTLIKSWEDYESSWGDDMFCHLKFYKATEVKVELTEVTVVKKVPVASKTTTKKVSK